MNESELPSSSPPEREAALVALALEQPVAARAAFLQAVCGERQGVAPALDALLAAHEQPDTVLATQADGPSHPVPASGSPMPPTKPWARRSGATSCWRRIGEGGCGVVYVAEQTEPVRRRVALKVIKLGMDTKQVVARFEAERQALAMMDHPNIAKVLDAGTTDTGRPYFVMELVRGIRITDYCDQDQSLHQGTARSVHQGLPGHPARAPEGDHPPRHQAVEHPRHAARRRAGAQGD